MKKNIKRKRNPNEELHDKVIRWSDRVLLGVSILFFLLAVIGVVKIYMI